MDNTQKGNTVSVAFPGGQKKYYCQKSGQLYLKIATSLRKQLNRALSSQFSTSKLEDGGGARTVPGFSPGLPRCLLPKIDNKVFCAFIRKHLRSHHL